MPSVAAHSSLSGLTKVLLAGIIILFSMYVVLVGSEYLFLQSVYMPAGKLMYTVVQISDSQQIVLLEAKEPVHLDTISFFGFTKVLDQPMAKGADLLLFDQNLATFPRNGVITVNYHAADGVSKQVVENFSKSKVYTFKNDFSKDFDLSDTNFRYIQSQGVLDTNKAVLFDFFPNDAYVLEAELKTSYPEGNYLFDHCVEENLRGTPKNCTPYQNDVTADTNDSLAHSFDECISQYKRDIALLCKQDAKVVDWETSRLLFNVVDKYNNFFFMILRSGDVQLSRITAGAIEHRLLYVHSDTNNTAWNNIKVVKLKDTVYLFVNDVYMGYFYDFQEGFFDYRKDFFKGQSGAVSVDCDTCYTQLRKLTVYSFR